MSFISISYQQNQFQAIGFSRKDTLQYSFLSTPPWLLHRPEINYSLHSAHKDDTAPEIFRHGFNELCADYNQFTRLYTDGSKIGDRVASAVVWQNSCKTVRLPNNASIFRAELYAINLSLNIIRRCRDKQFIIFSDSMSSLQALSGFKLEIDLVQRILKDYTALTNCGKSIVFCWIPSHVNIRGNERADTAAKSALSLPITNMKLPGCDLIPRVSKHCSNEWQDIWSNCANNKLFAIYQHVGTAGHNKSLTRREAAIINRLRIGHTRLTHSYLLSGDDQPTCSTCGHPLTVRHILLDCTDLQDVRDRHFSVTSLRDLFESVNNRVVIDFIKDIHYYSLL